eukprot:TRINITY_DN582_c0_g1_i1.p1 TRINITY_DN582_c0_g1~~TRINITY_DN582_c0_g1_i1.p1  ORF type:complete len:195 (+),score=50.62 TRINITY_DN582_c0_g1_i1:63-647(+)
MSAKESKKEQKKREKQEKKDKKKEKKEKKEKKKDKKEKKMKVDTPTKNKQAPDTSAEDKRPKKKQKTTHLSPISKPLASDDLRNEIFELNKKAAKEKALRRGVKEVVKALKKQERGLCVIAGDISPIDVITHLPVLCEEANVPYVYVLDKEDLGLSSGCKRPTSCVLVAPKPDSSLNSSLNEIVKAVNKLPKPY